MFRKRTSAFCLAALTVALPTVLLSAGPSTAAPAGQASVISLESAAAEETEDLRLVRRIAETDSRWEVWTAAWSAYTSDDPNAAADFLRDGGGYAEAQKLADKNEADNDEFIAYILITYAESSQVWKAAERVSRPGTSHAAKYRFVRTGFKKAEAEDAKGAGKPAQVAEQAKADRHYVAELAATAPGDWVREAAARAIDLGTDAAIAEFFAYSWASAAESDAQAFRIAVANETLKFRSRLAELIVEAERAQKAFEGAADAARAKAAADARTAWNTLADASAATQRKWLAEQDLATAQALSWAAVRDFALRASTQQDWPGIAAQAESIRLSWDDDVAWAKSQAEHWSEQADAAHASANAIPVTPSPIATTSGTFR